MGSSRSPRLCLWDSGTFIRVLRADEDGWRDCVEILRQAQRGEVRIYASALVHAEVLAGRRKPSGAIPESQKEAIRDLFRQDYIERIAADLSVMERAADLYWQFNTICGLGRYDAVHLATAVLYGVPEIHTFDDQFAKCSEKVGVPPIRIVRPWTQQRDLFDGSAEV